MAPKTHKLHCVGHHATGIIVDHMARRARGNRALAQALTRILELPGINAKLLNVTSPGRRTILVTAPSTLLLELHSHVVENNVDAINELYLRHCRAHKAG